jgi:hypothetical protein
VGHSSLASKLALVVATSAIGSAIELGCGKKDDPSTVAPAASGLPASTVDPKASVWHYVVDPKSATHVDMVGLKEHIRGETSAADGTLDIVPGNLAQSRGEVRVDLSTFATHTFGTADDATQTKHARTWLEVQMGDHVNQEMRWAVFAIRSIDALSATDLAQVAPTKKENGDVRVVTMTVHGDLLVHGHKTARDAPVELDAFYPPGGARPARVEIHSKGPMPVTLKEHDVRPRDPAGEALAWTTQLISKVAETADVTVDLGATPAP